MNTTPEKESRRSKRRKLHPSPSDIRRAQARAAGFKSARLRVLRKQPEPVEEAVVAASMLGLVNRQEAA